MVRVSQGPGPNTILERSRAARVTGTAPAPGTEHVAGMGTSKG